MLLRLFEKSRVLSRLVPQRYFSDETKEKFCFIPDCQRFDKLVKEANPFVDKSVLIYELLKSKNKAILFTRPRRWGKTLILSMLNNFFQADIDKTTGNISYHTKSNKHLFENLKIKNARLSYDPVTNENKKTSLLDCQGSFPVINMAFKDGTEYGHENVIKHFTRMLSPTFKEHSYLLNVEGRLFGQGRKLFEKLVFGENLEKYELFISLEVLIKALNKHYNRKVVVLLDEYDKYLLKLAHFNSPFYENALDLTKGFLSPLKSQEKMLLLTVLTGESNAVKSEISPELDHFQQDSVMKSKYPEFFGFTESEAINLIRKIENFMPILQIEDVIKNIKDRHKGYSIDGKIIYNPWSIMTYLNSFCMDQENPYSNSWVSSVKSSFTDNNLIKLFDTKSYLRLVSKGYVKFTYKDSYKLRNMDNDEDLIMSYLVDAGYITCKEENIFKIPNYEIRGYYVNDICQLWLKKLGIDPNIFKKHTSKNFQEKHQK